MTSPSNCFSQALTQNVKITSIYDNDSSMNAWVESREASDEDSLRRAFADAESELCCCQIISICQRNSYRPLQVTSSMMDFITQTFDISLELSDLTQHFYQRNLDIEETTSLPWMRKSVENAVEFMYTMRYPEYKAAPDDNWVIRQTGLYQQLRKGSRCLYILLEPSPKSRLSQAIQEIVRRDGFDPRANPMWLHQLLLSTYLPTWRDYLLSIDVQFLPLTNKAFANYIEQDLLVGHDDLGTLYMLQTRSLQVSTILGHTKDLLRELNFNFLHDSDLIGDGSIRTSMGDSLKRLEGKCICYAQTATYLHRRLQSTIGLLSTTLSLRDQVVAKEQNDIMMEQNRTTVEQNRNMIRLNKSAVFITAVTLVYLPSSWIASFFGMNFFDLDDKTHRLIASPMIWIFLVASALLTGATFVLYYFLLQRDGRLFKELQPRVRPLRGPITSFANISRRFTASRKADETELTPVAV